MSDDTIRFHWDPICPFAWITSRWLVKVVEQRGDQVDWRFISLRMLNEHLDYDEHFPPEYPRLHGAGLKMLRVAAKIRADEGPAAMGPLYDAFGASIWDQPPPPAPAPAPAPGEVSMPGVGEPEHIESVLAGIGLDTAFAAAAEDTSWDDDIRADTEAALDRTGRDVGTPIIAIGTEGPAFFGPVISRIPDDVEAVELWDSVIKLAEFGGFAELKRSLREMPRLAALGWDGGDETAPEQDWQGGSVASN